jgi:2-keto-4-pentenoate hydratase
MGMNEARKSVLNELAGMLSASWRAPGNPVKVDPYFYPRDRSEAYFVQDRMHDELGQGLAGWKVGATSQKMRELDGHDDVIPGRIFASRSYVGARQILSI